MKEETVLSVLQEIRGLLEVISNSLAGKETPQVVTKPDVLENQERFVNNEDGTVSDNLLKVVWVKDPTVLGAAFQKTMTFDEAKAACEGLSYAGYSAGWRLPTVKELRSIVDYTRHDPAWDINVFAGKHDDWYWASTPCAWSKQPDGSYSAAWAVSSGLGYVDVIGKGNHNYVRPVRSCQ